MRKIPLTKGKFAIVDDSDYLAIGQMRWHYTGRYAARRIEGKIIMMHRYLLGGESLKDVDHVNGDALDNRRKNIRFATPQENAWNSKAHKDSSSKFKGVSWDKVRKKWVAMLYLNKRLRNLGRFETQCQAASRYNDVAAVEFGNFARLNKI